MKHFLALGQNWEKEKYIEMMNTALNYYPDYCDYYLSLAYGLLPRWLGDEFDEWEKFISQALEKIESDTADEIYTRAVLHNGAANQML